MEIQLVQEEEAPQYMGIIILIINSFFNYVYYNRGHFEDEISTELKHTGAGVLSMANR